MEDLRVLVSLLTAQKVKQIEIITEDAEMSPKTRQLYEAIQSGEVSSDDEAAKLLYGENANHAAYRKLKYRLQQRLINTLFFIDIQAYSKSEYEKTVLRSLKNWAAYKILLNKGIKFTALSLGETILKSSLKYDILELSLSILKDLKYEYGIVINNKYKYEKYSIQLRQIQELFNLRIQAEDVYIKLIRRISHTRNLTIDNELKEIEKDIKALLNNQNILNSFYTYFFSLKSAELVYNIKKDIINQLNISTNAITYFKKHTQFNNFALFAFTKSQGVCYLSLKQFDKAILSFKNCLDLLPNKNGLTWISLNNYIFTVHILKRDYKVATELLFNILSNNFFNKQSETLREPWYLKEAFIHFLIKIQKIKEEEIEHLNLRPFRLSRFLNEVSVFAKDKRGHNITINILQMLFLIVDEKYDEVLDKLSSLRQYNFRYLKRPEYVRSSTFIKMLLKIPEGDYKASTIRQKSQKYYEKLLEHPNDFSEHSLSLEIIPYEQLWEELLSIFPEN